MLFGSHMYSLAALPLVGVLLLAAEPLRQLLGALLAAAVPGRQLLGGLLAAA